ncbi:MAG: ABC transporter substrate-binding protein [Actinomycetota bacterium]
MSCISRLAVTALVASVSLAACSSGEDAGLAEGGRLAVARRQDVPVGGTLMVGALKEAWSGLDPQQEYSNEGWALLRCCLLRTLLSYNNLPIDEGGADTLPDLAVSPPSVSRDGLTWTFRLRRGVHYAPPLEEVEIQAQDFVRALEREATNPGAQYAFYYSIIEGFDRFSAGQADSISGLEARDDHTLVVHVTEPVGHVANLFTLPATAPIPPNPHAPGAQLGVAQGHDDGYGRYLVASGPYMIDGSEDLDFSAPPDEQEPVAGYKPGRELVLVRNPSWKRESDLLRPAYVDRVEMNIGREPREYLAAVNAGQLDVVWDVSHPERRVRSFESDPDLEDRVLNLPSNGVWYVPLNLAEPPFDDIHVRRALNYAFNKTRVVRAAAPTAFAIGHVGSDFLEGNLLLGYDPFRTPGGRGDLSRARAEMSRSRYDADGDGVCDHPACTEVDTPTLRPTIDIPPQTARWVRRDFRRVGVELKLRPIKSVDTYFDRLGDARRRNPLGIAAGFVSDFPNGAGYFPALFAGEVAGTGSCCNWSLVGATPEQLRTWGYSVTKVPNVEAKLNECAPLVGDPQTRCWAELDMMVMEKIVPWVPMFTKQRNRIVSERVVNYSIDSLVIWPALDHFALQDE